MGKYYSKNTLIQNLQKKEHALGRVPIPEDMTDPSAQSYIHFFGKWAKALKAAGITPGITFSSEQKKVSSTEENISKIENSPDNAEIILSDLSTHPHRRRYSKTIITQMLLDEFKRLGKKPTRKEIDANKSLPTVSTCLNYFGTTRIGDVWDEILNEL
ncbi:MAG: hypothetical protein RR310_00105 [Eubacterium sp.]